jgi:hypothetical protein
VGAAAQPLKHAASFPEVARFAKDRALKRDDGIRAENQAVGKHPRDFHGLALCVDHAKLARRPGP